MKFMLVTGKMTNPMALASISGLIAAADLCQSKCVICIAVSGREGSAMGKGLSSTRMAPNTAVGLLIVVLID